MRASISNETTQRLIAGEKVGENSFFPIDQRDCACDSIKRDWVMKFSKMIPEEIKAAKKENGPIRCPKSLEEGYKKYQIICAICGDLIGNVYLKDKDINSWCDLHYINEAKLVTRKEIFHIEKINKKGIKKLVPIKKDVQFGEWHGCMSPSISPLDGLLGFECACGNDTRDFRAKNNLTGFQLQTKLKENMIGREFFKDDSKFILKEIK